MPETCGYTTKKHGVDFVLAVPYDGCNVIQEVCLHKRDAMGLKECSFNLVYMYFNFGMTLRKVNCVLLLSPEWKLCVEDEMA